MVQNLLGTGQALDASINTIISEFRLLTDEKTIFEDVADEMTLMPGDGPTKYVNNYNRLTAFSVADAADIAQTQALADTQTSYTPGEVAVQTWLPGSTMRRSADRKLLANTSKILMNALNLKIDQDGGLQLPNFTPIIGAAARVLGPGEYLAAVTRLETGDNRSNPEPPPLPYVIVDHPYKLSTVAGRIIPLTDVPTGTNIYLPASTSRGPTTGQGFGGALSDQLIRQGRHAIKMLFNVRVESTANVIPDSADDVSGAAFCKMGLVYVKEVEKRLDPDRSDVSYRGAVELNGWTSYVWGTYRPGAYGVEILGDATSPTS